MARLRARALGALFALAAAGAAGADAQEYDFTAARALLEGNLDRYAGGVFVQIFQDDREIFVFRAGPVEAQTRLRMASATKWLSSAVISRLADTGALDFD